MSKSLDTTLAVLNGLVGNYLARTKNGLATEMGLFHHDRPLVLEREALSGTDSASNPMARAPSRTGECQMSR